MPLAALSWPWRSAHGRGRKCPEVLPPSFRRSKKCPHLGLLCTVWSLHHEGRDVTPFFFSTPSTVACQAPLSMEFSRQEYCRLPLPSPGDLLHPRTEPGSSAWQAVSLPLNHLEREDSKHKVLTGSYGTTCQSLKPFSGRKYNVVHWFLNVITQRVAGWLKYKLQFPPPGFLIH